MYDDNSKVIRDTKDYVTIGDDGKAVADASNANVLQEVSDTNADRQAKAKALLDSKIAMASNVTGSASSSGAVRITGQDSEIELNGATFTNNSNNYSINGLTIEAMEVTGNDEVTITTNTDVDGIYDMIKGFLKDYNDLVKSVDVAYNAASSKDMSLLQVMRKMQCLMMRLRSGKKRLRIHFLEKTQHLEVFLIL